MQNEVPEKNKSILANLKTKMDVNNWKRYLYLGETLIKSSKKLIKIKGKHNIDRGKSLFQLFKNPNIKS